jgi:dephospho-CoA kinase
VKKGLPAWERIAAHFGKQILLPNGELDRKHLANIIFNDPSQKQMLNQIVHPFVFEEIERQVNEIRHKTPLSVVISDIPLLMESGMHKNLSEVILVYIPKSLQIERLMKRNKFSEAEAKARIRAQMPIDEKKHFATMIIDNSGDLENTRNQAVAVYQKLFQQR